MGKNVAPQNRNVYQSATGFVIRIGCAYRDGTFPWRLCVYPATHIKCGGQQGSPAPSKESFLGFMLVSKGARLPQGSLLLLYAALGIAFGVQLAVRVTQLLHVS
jgi:hypothetical protein